MRSDRSYRVAFKVIAYANYELLQSIRLIVGGQAILLEKFEATDSQSNKQYIFSGIISYNLISASDTYTEFVFKTHTTTYVKLPENSPINSYNASFSLYNLLLQPIPKPQ